MLVQSTSVLCGERTADHHAILHDEDMKRANQGVNLIRAARSIVQYILYHISYTAYVSVGTVDSVKGEVVLSANISRQ